MRWHPHTFPQHQQGEGHARGARACRKLQRAANERVATEYFKPYPDVDSPQSGEEWGYIVGPGGSRRAVPRRMQTAATIIAAKAEKQAGAAAE